MTGRQKKLAVIAVAIIGMGGGLMTTMAAFNGQTRNPGNSFASGTLVLSNMKEGETACLSTAGGTTNNNVNDNCDQLIGVTVRKPGDTATGRLTLSNEGSLDASSLNLHMPGCTTGDAPDEAFHGTGDMCSALRFYVQRYSDAGFNTKSSCVYGGGDGTVCDFSDSAKTLAAFASAYTAEAPADLGALASDASGYYEIGVHLHSSAGNSLQGRQATFDLTWLLEQ